MGLMHPGEGALEIQKIHEEHGVPHTFSEADMDHIAEYNVQRKHASEIEGQAKEYYGTLNHPDAVDYLYRNYNDRRPQIDQEQAALKGPAPKTDYPDPHLPSNPYHAKLAAEKLVRDYNGATSGLAKRYVEGEWGTPAEWNDDSHPLNPKNFLPEHLKRQGQQIELDHLTTNHSADMDLNDAGKPYCRKCADVVSSSPKCSTCGKGILIADPVKGTWSHDPGYSGRVEHFDLGAAMQSDAHHTPQPILPPA